MALGAWFGRQVCVDGVVSPRLAVTVRSRRPRRTPPQRRPDRRGRRIQKDVCRGELMELGKKESSFTPSRTTPAPVRREPRAIHAEVLMRGRRCGFKAHASIGYPQVALTQRPLRRHRLIYRSASARIAWIRSSAVRSCVRCRSLFFTMATIPASPSTFPIGGAGLTFGGRPGPRFGAPPMRAFTL